MGLENHLSLVHWTSSNHGYLHPNIELAYDVDKGYHARVASKKVVEAGLCVARCPMTTSLSVLNALHTPPFSCRGTRLPSAFLRHQETGVVQCFFLMEQFVLQEKSWWAPYLSTLPKPNEIESHHFTGTRGDLAWLKGTNLELAIPKQIETWKAQFSKGMDQLKKLQWPNALNESYTWELFRWASTMFGSRSFTSQVLSNTLPADKARPMGHLDPDHDVLSDLFEDGFAVLLPLLDLLNYRPLSKVEWQAGLNEVGLQILETFDGGQEVCNNYGPRDNEALMLGYGFSVPHNPFDHYAVGFRVPPGSPLEEARAWRATQSTQANRKSKMDDQYRYYIFNVDHPRAKTARSLETSLFSLDLFDSISILSANSRELDSLRFRSTGSILNIDAKRPIDRTRQRNLLHTLCQLRLECSSRSELLRVNALTWESSSTTAMTSKQQYAKLYRDSQLLITETAALLCRYCLLKAQAPGKDDSALISSAAVAERLPQTSEAVANLEKLVHRMHPSINSRTLFTFSDATATLPANLARIIRDAAEAFSRALAVKAHSTSQQQPTKGDRTRRKLEFASFLIALRKISSEGSMVLPSHLESWMRDVQKWYPFDDPFWNGPTEDFLPTLETLLENTGELIADPGDPAMDAAWSDPQMICWGWNVQEEEAIFGDAEPPEPHGDGAVYQPSTYFLCMADGGNANGA